MSTITIDKDTVAATLTVTARLTAPVERVWQVWSDPRQLERWWGPPTYPATVVDHDLSPGGTVTYFMTSPEGEMYHGWWKITASTPPHALSFVDGFADDAGNPNPDLPTTTTHVTLTDDVDGTTMVIESRFASSEAMAQLMAMGMEEGLTAALGQIDGLLVSV